MESPTETMAAVVANHDCEPKDDVIVPANESETTSFSPVDEFTFVCNGLDSFLDGLSSNSDLSQGPVPGVRSDACAEDTDPDYRCLEPPSDIRGDPDRGSCSSPASTLPPCEFTIKEFEGPKPITCFNNCIRLASAWKYLKGVKFLKQPLDCSEVEAASKLRFPAHLKYLYVKNSDIKKESDDFSPPSSKRRKKTRRGRLSLNEHDFNNDDCFKKRTLLPSDNDLHSVMDQTFPNVRRIPYLYRCFNSNSSSDCSSNCAQQVGNFKLFMEINRGQPFPALVRENIASIKGESCIIDEMSAMIAVTAVTSSNSTNTRLFLPVSSQLKNKIGCLKEMFADVSDQKYEIVPAVTDTVEALVDYVVRQDEVEKCDHHVPSSLNSSSDDIARENADDSVNSESPSCPNSPSSKPTKRRETNKVIRELKKLINISVTEEEEGESELSTVDDVKCTRSHCVLGCVCSSLNEKPPPAEHCGNSSCMFGCECSDKSRVEYINCGELAKDEKTWHQTVIRKRNNDLEIKSGIDRSKRTSKMPSKYKNTFFGEQQMRQCLKFRREDIANKGKSQNILKNKAASFENRIKSTTDSQKLLKEVGTNNLLTIDKPKTQTWKLDPKSQNSDKVLSAGDKIRRTLNINYDNMMKESNDRRMALSTGEDTATLADVFIWCTVHDKYDCFCTNWIVMTKNFNLVHKPIRSNKWSVSKNLEKVSIRTPDIESREVVMYDQARHCARSVGSLYNYRARNKTSVFKTLSKHLLKNHVSSYSNGFVKARPIAMLRVTPDEIPPENIPFVAGIDKMVGVGNVELLSRVSTLAESRKLIDVGKPADVSRFIPPDNFQILSDDEPSGEPESILLDDDFSVEIVPKPRTKGNIPIPKPCFSVYQKQPKPASTKEEPEDEDVVLVEDEIECYSLSSTESIEDGGTVSDTSSDDDAEAKSSFGQKRHMDTVNTLDKSRSSSPENKVPKIDLSTAGLEVTDSYPKLGLFCMHQPCIGYLTVKQSVPGSITVEDPTNPNTFRTFNSSKDASEYMKKLVGLFIKSEWAKEEWVMVTKGVLEKYNCKRFSDEKFAKDLYGKSVPSTPPADAKAKSILKRKVSSPKNKGTTSKLQCTSSTEVSSAQNTGPQATVESKASDTSASGKSVSTTPSPSKKKIIATLTNKNSTSAFIGGLQSTPVYLRHCAIQGPHPATTVGGMRKVNQQLQFVRLGSLVPRQPNPPSSSGSGLKAITLRGPASPQHVVLSMKVGPQVTTTGMARSPMTATVTSRFPVLLSAMPVSSSNGNTGPNSPNASSSALTSATTGISTTNSIVTATSALATTPIVSSSASKPPTSETIEPASSSQHTETSSDPVDTNNPPTSTNPSYVIESFSSEASPVQSSSTTLVVKAHRVLLPKTAGTPQTPSQPLSVQYRQRIPPRRADVIIPRKDGFATLISPAPTEPSPIPKTPTSSDSKVFNGIVLPKVDKKEGVKGFICDKKYTSYRSLLPKR